MIGRKSLRGKAHEYVASDGIAHHGKLTHHVWAGHCHGRRG